MEGITKTNGNIANTSEKDKLYKRQQMKIDMYDELLSQSWLSDKTFNAYFEVLKKKLNLKERRIKIFDPVVVSGYKNFNSELIFNPMFKKPKDLMIMLVSNADDIDEEGSHWSLLYYLPTNKLAYHFDSNRHMNLSHARKILSQFQSHLQTPGEIHFKSVKCYKQINSDDCGVYSILALEAVLLAFCETYPETNDISIESCLEPIKPSVPELKMKRALMAFAINHGAKMSREELIAMIRLTSKHEVENLKERLERMEVVETIHPVPDLLDNKRKSSNSDMEEESKRFKNDEERKQFKNP